MVRNQHGQEVESVVEQSIGFITGDGIGVDIMPVAQKVIGEAVRKAYKEKRRIIWREILVGDRAVSAGKERLSKEALKEIKELRTVLKGPLTTPVGGGHRSLNVTIRQELDLYACVRPVKWIPGVPAPVKNPEKLDIVIFRENTEDVYAGIEWPPDSGEAGELRTFLAKRGHELSSDTGLGIKPISRAGSARLVRAAIRYAFANNRRSITIVHKGNIMKHTEGLFKSVAYEVAREFSGVVKEGEREEQSGDEPKLIIKDRIADSIFQQLLLRPDEYDILATTNLNGDYLSDAAAAQVGGLGLAPGANINYETGLAVFEATHGTAPKYAGQDKVNPGSLILSGVMMLQHLGWNEAAELLLVSMERTIKEKRVTYDLERQMKGATLLSTSQFGEAVIENLNLLAQLGDSGKKSF